MGGGENFSLPSFALLFNFIFGHLNIGYLNFICYLEFDYWSLNYPNSPIAQPAERVAVNH